MLRFDNVATRRGPKINLDELTDFGRRLHWALDSAGYAVTTAGPLLGLTKAHMSRVIRDEADKVAVGVLLKAAKLCNVHLEWLATGLGAREASARHDRDEAVVTARRFGAPDETIDFVLARDAKAGHTTFQEWFDAIMAENGERVEKQQQATQAAKMRKKARRDAHAHQSTKTLPEAPPSVAAIPSRRSRSA